MLFYFDYILNWYDHTHTQALFLSLIHKHALANIPTYTSPPPPQEGLEPSTHSLLQVSPSELEDLLRQCPAVVDVGVVGVPDDRLGEAPRAYVVTSKMVSEAFIHG